MLKKLYKHEFYSLLRSLLPIYAALIGFAALSRLSFLIDIENKDGKLYFHTKGINNDLEDPLVSESQIMGKVIYKSIILSFISKIVNNSYGFYFVIFIPFAILVAMEIIDIIEDKKDRKNE